jgi:hypothetical protein
MGQLAACVLHLYPASAPLRDWIVSNDGTGQVLSYWNPALGPQPTAQQLADAELPAAKALRIADINAECRSRLLARFGDAAEQVSRSLGIYGQAEKTALENGIAATIDASNTASDAVLAAADIATVEAVTVAWPAI